MCSLVESRVRSWSSLQEDSITEVPPIFEKWEAKNLSWNLACGVSETKNGVNQALSLVYVDACWRAVTLHLENVSLMAPTICMKRELGSHACSHNAAHESHKPTTNTPKHGADV